MKHKIDAEVARQWCERAQTLTLKNGIYRGKEMKTLPGYCVFTRVAQLKGFTEQPRRGTFRWKGPENVTILTGEALFRAYRDYDVNRTKTRKPNGQPEKSLRQQIAELNDAIAFDELRTEVDVLKKQVSAIMELIG